MLHIGTIGALNLALPQVLAAGEQSASKGRSPELDCKRDGASVAAHGRL
jgi:hypothetical protein